MSKLTKRDIVVSISNQTGMVQHQVFEVVQKTLDQITDSLAAMWRSNYATSAFFSRVSRNPGSGAIPTNRAAVS